MVKRSVMLPAGCGFAAGFRGLLTAAIFALAACPALAAAPASAAAPRAQLITVDLRFLEAGTAEIPGAGVRAFQDSLPAEAGTERIDIHWHASPPGVPPGTVLLLECLQGHSPSVRNRTVSIPSATEGHVHSVIEIPPDDIRKDGRIRQWRVSLVWRGRILDRRASRNWEG